MPRQMLRVIQQQDLIIFIYVINNIYIADTHSSKRQPKKGGEAQTYKKKKRKERWISEKERNEKKIYKRAIGNLVDVAKI